MYATTTFEYVSNSFFLQAVSHIGEGATVDLRVLICARCAKVLSEGDRGTEVSGPEVSQVQGQRLEMKDHGLDASWVGL